MALEEITMSLATETTRRTVVKTGVKLAYAAPLVAATMKLSAGGAAAISNVVGQCNADSGQVCNEYEHCGTSSGGHDCVCHRTSSGSTICGAYGSCIAEGGTACNVDSDCGTITGSNGDKAPGFCHTRTCCALKDGFVGVCAPRCQ